MFLRGRYNYRRQKRWRHCREKLKKVTVLLNFEQLKLYFQSMIELPKIRMYEEENVEKMWHRFYEYDSGEHGTAKLELESW